MRAWRAMIVSSMKFGLAKCLLLPGSTSAMVATGMVTGHWCTTGWDMYSDQCLDILTSLRINHMGFMSSLPKLLVHIEILILVKN